MWSATKAQRALGWREAEHAPVDRFAEGYAAARATVEAELAAERTMLLQMIESIAAPEPRDDAALARVLATAVARLVRDIVGSAPIDPEMLRARCEALATAMTPDEAAVTVTVHPDCVPFLDGLDARFLVVGNAAIAHGTVKLVSGEGGFEDGVEHALRRLDEAFAQMGAA